MGILSPVVGYQSDRYNSINIGVQALSRWEADHSWAVGLTTCPSLDGLRDVFETLSPSRWRRTQRAVLNSAPFTDWRGPRVRLFS